MPAILEGITKWQNICWFLSGRWPVAWRQQADVRRSAWFHLKAILICLSLALLEAALGRFTCLLAEESAVCRMALSYPGLLLSIGFKANGCDLWLREENHGEVTILLLLILFPNRTLQPVAIQTLLLQVRSSKLHDNWKFPIGLLSTNTWKEQTLWAKVQDLSAGSFEGTYSPSLWMAELPNHYRCFSTLLNPLPDADNTWISRVYPGNKPHSGFCLTCPCLSLSHKEVVSMMLAWNCMNVSPSFHCLKWKRTADYVACSAACSYHPNQKHQRMME